VTSVLAVAIHDVEPRSFARSREIRSWLERRGVERVTLLVIPAADLHPIGARSPELAAWLCHRVASGDVVAQHGLVHRAGARARWPRSVLAAWQGGAAAEFPGLTRDDAACRVAAGRRLLREIELDPRGFVAPGYAYTRALRGILAESHEWFADFRAIRAKDGDVHARALCLGSSTVLKRTLSPIVVRAGARTTGEVMRVDIHPQDFDQPSHITTLEKVLQQARAQSRSSVTYDDLSAERLGSMEHAMAPAPGQRAPQPSQDPGQREGAAAGVRSMPIAGSEWTSVGRPW
jgi:predicted deacetylase